MSKSEKIQLIISQLCGGIKRNFARKVGIGETTLSSWLSRDSMDPWLIANAFPEINLDWLLRDQGEMIEPTFEVSEMYEPGDNIKEPTPAYRKAPEVKETEELVTIPASLLASLQQQLENKDAQIATLLEIMNK